MILHFLKKAGFNLASRLLGNGQIAELKVGLSECKSGIKGLHDRFKDVEKYICDDVNELSNSLKEVRHELSELKSVLLKSNLRGGNCVNTGDAKEFYGADSGSPAVGDKAKRV